MPLNQSETAALSRAVEQAGGGAETLMRVYLHLCDRLATGPANIPQTEIARNLGLAVETIRRVGKMLTAHRLVSAQSSPFGTMWDLPQRPRVEGKSRFVYVVGTPDLAMPGRCVAPCKIGRAKEPNNRLSALSTGSPYRLTMVGALRFSTPRVAEAVEIALHEEFDAYRLHGEWFRIDPHALWDNVLTRRFPHAVHRPDKKAGKDEDAKDEDAKDEIAKQDLKEDVSSPQNIDDEIENDAVVPALG